MNSKNNGSLSGLLGGVGVLALLALLTGGKSNFFSSFGRLALIAGGVLLILLAVILFFALKGSSDEADGGIGSAKLTSDQSKILADGHKELSEIRVLNAKIMDRDIRLKSNEICSLMEKLLRQLREKPDQIEHAQMFMLYYLPTQKSIIRKFVALEKTNPDHQPTEEQVMGYLKDIQAAMQEQCDSLYEDAFLDLSAEMEVMRRSIERDGFM